MPSGGAASLQENDYVPTAITVGIPPNTVGIDLRRWLPVSIRPSANLLDGTEFKPSAPIYRRHTGFMPRVLCGRRHIYGRRGLNLTGGK
jgi:hypothetical protein